MASRPTKAQIGYALDQLVNDVKDHILEAIAQAKAFDDPQKTALMKQALTLPNLARAQVTAWMAGYDAKNGANAARTFLAACLTAAGSTATLASIDTALAALEAQALVLVNHRKNDGWTWDQIIAAVEAAVAAAPVVQFTYDRLPIPAGYQTVWGESW